MLVLPTIPTGIALTSHSALDAVRITGTTHTIAQWVMQLAEWFLGIFHLEHSETLAVWVYAVCIFLIAEGTGYLMKWCVLWIVRIIGRRNKPEGIYYLLSSHKFFLKFCRIIPPIVFLIFIEFTLSTHTLLAFVLTRATWLYILYAIGVAINTLISAIWERIDSVRNTRKLPLNGLRQLMKGLIWIMLLIVAIAIILNKSPTGVLAGLGAFAAVLMLIFKDSILGVVAGVQLSENDSLHVGDWIAVKGTDANGIVTDVSLTTVKVENWDKTITCLPPYQLISGSFTNYRNMQQSDTRRINRYYMIDADSIIPADDKFLSRIAELPMMKAYIEGKQKQAASGNTRADAADGLVAGTIDTNIGLFRAYLQMWLDANPQISHTDTAFVTTQQQTPHGIPLSIYCFTATSSWLSYEAIQAAIFEHIAVMMPKFGLYTFEYASSIQGVVSASPAQG